jgi:hypothetical protein
LQSWLRILKSVILHRYRSTLEKLTGITKIKPALAQCFLMLGRVELDFQKPALTQR